MVILIHVAGGFRPIVYTELLCDACLLNVVGHAEGYSEERRIYRRLDIKIVHNLIRWFLITVGVIYSHR